MIRRKKSRTETQRAQRKEGKVCHRFRLDLAGKRDYWITDG
jgi:hypothetical protein